jgi:hypothetical protein
VTRPNVQSMTALAIVTALMAHLKKGGELSSADADSVLDRASSLLKVFNLSFNDVTKADEVFATVRDALKK